MASKPFQFRLITPQGKIVDAPAVAANVPAHDGMLGFLPDRAPIVTTLGMGALTVTMAQGGGRSFYVEDGFAQMTGGKLTVLTTKAVPTEDLTETDAKAELAAAEGKGAKARRAAETKLRLVQSRAGRGI